MEQLLLPFLLILAFAVNQFNVQNTVNATQLQHDVIGNIVANGNSHDIGVGFRSAANLHAVDVDAGLAQNSSHLANHVRTIDVRR